MALQDLRTKKMRFLVQLACERDREREGERERERERKEGSCCSCLQQMQATTAEAISMLVKNLSFLRFRFCDNGSPFAEIPSKHFGGQLFARQSLELPAVRTMARPHARQSWASVAPRPGACRVCTSARRDLQAYLTHPEA